MPSLVDWYPRSVDRLTLALGRLICQRMNCWWDAEQRRRYATTIAIAFAFAFALASGATLLNFLFLVAAPLSPSFSLAFRQITEQRDAADRLEKLKTHLERLWSEVLLTITSDGFLTQARVLQDEIFDGRKRNPLVFDAIFKVLRSGHEDTMVRTADELISEILNKGQTS
jgi:hypothetical protein